MGCSLLFLGEVEGIHAEPHILVGPSDADEEPVSVDRISGLTYDQLKKLRELRKWLDAREKIREERALRREAQETRALSFFKDRELLTPLGQRAPQRSLNSQRSEDPPLNLPPLPVFEDSQGQEESESNAIPASENAPHKMPPRLSHITPPPRPEDRDSVQMEFELSPGRELGIED